MDGILAAFHVHADRAPVDLVAARVAAQVGAAADEVGSLLRDDRTAILGGRRLLWPWREGVQWNPADDLWVAIQIRHAQVPSRPHDSRTWRLEGELVEVAPRYQRPCRWFGPIADRPPGPMSY